MNPIVVASSDRVTATHVGGVTTYVERLYDSLREIDVDLRVFGIRTRAKGVRRSVAYAKQEALALPRMARKAGADILHYPADTGPIRTSRGLPTVVTIHGAAALHERGIRKPIAERVWMTRVRRAGVVADAIVTDSESSRADVAALVGDRRRADIVVIPLAVDPGRFYPVDRDHVESVRSRHGLEDRYLLYVGNLEPRKNIAELVRAVELLNERGHRLPLYVVGRPAWDFDQTLDAIRASRHARHLGRLPDDEVRALMSGCEAFVFPSRYEGFGLPVLEAMACGARVVCTRRGSLPEVAGDAATFTEGTSAEAIADALRRSLALDRADAFVNGRAQAARFSWETCAQAHRDLFEQLL